MHPELLRTIAKDRHEDLLAPHPARGQPRVRHREHVPLFSRTRHRLGSVLIRAGGRLVDDRPGELDLARPRP
jgi:hypothetical protein